MILEDLFSWKVCTCIACFSSKIFYGMRLMVELFTFGQLGKSSVKGAGNVREPRGDRPAGDRLFPYRFGAHSPNAGYALPARSRKARGHRRLTAAMCAVSWQAPGR